MSVFDVVAFGAACFALGVATHYILGSPLVRMRLMKEAKERQARRRQLDAAYAEQQHEQIQKMLEVGTPYKCGGHVHPTVADGEFCRQMDVADTGVGVRLVLESENESEVVTISPWCCAGCQKLIKMVLEGKAYAVRNDPPPRPPPTTIPSSGQRRRGE